MSDDLNPTNIPTSILLDFQREAEAKAAAIQREANYAAAVESFGKHIKLVYAAYDDKFSDKALNALLHGDYEEAAWSTDEWEAESRFYGVQGYIDNLPRDLREAVEEDGRLLDDLTEYLYDHDQSTWWDDMLRNSDSQLLLYRIGEDAHEAEGIIDALASVGLDPEANADVVDELLANNGHYGGTVYIMWYGPVDELTKAHDGKARTITWQNPRILAYCHYNGAGYEAEAHGTASIAYDHTAIHIDGFGPSYSVDECFGFHMGSIANDPVLALA